MDLEYRKEKTEKVLDKYRDLVEKIFVVVDMDKLEAEIKNAEDDEEGEARLLTKITNRKKALEHIEDLVERIERLEDKLIPKEEKSNGATESLHPTKRFAKK